jgi:Predicted ATPase
LPARDEAGKRVEIETELMASETALASLQDPVGFPDLHLIRRTMLDWRFYHEMRTDSASPLRGPCLAVTSPTLASDGSNLAAVFATLVHIREDTVDLDRAIEDAFPGRAWWCRRPARCRLRHGLSRLPKRVFDAAELSDGTLRYLALAGRCSPIACRDSSPSTSPRRACTPICWSRWRASSSARRNAARSGSSPIPEPWRSRSPSMEASRPAPSSSARARPGWKACGSPAISAREDQARIRS